MNSYEPHGTKVTVRVKSSNDKTNWSNWEEIDNGLNLKLTPNGRYLEVEVTLEKFSGSQSPVVYDVTVNTLNLDAMTTDPGVSITGDKNTLDLGDAVKLTVTSFNNGPNSADVKVNYKIPIGLKLLSSQGTGTYDPDTGVWSVGILPAGGSATMEMILQANNAGYFVNLVSVYGDLVLFSTKSLSSAPKGVVKAWSVKAASSMPDSNPGNNQASYDITSIDPGQTADTNTFTYDFPPVTPPTQPQPPNNPPTPPGPTPPEPQPPGPTPPNNPSQPTGQLGRDIAGVINAVSSGSTDDNIPEWNPGQDNTNSNSNSDIYEVINHLKFILDMLMLLDDILTILFLIGLSALLIWALFAVLGSLGVFTGLFVAYVIILILVAFFLVIYYTLLQYLRPVSKE